MVNKTDFDLNISSPATTRDMVYEKIYNGIVLGYFKPGERLLERDLAEKMGISRTPVREALLQLEKANFVHVLPYRGVAVAQLSYKTARETYQLRQLLEGTAAGLAAERCRRGKLSEEIEMLRQNIEEYSTSYDEGNPYDTSVINLDFHMLIAQMSGNSMLEKNIKNLQIYMGLLHNVTLASRIGDTIKEHTEVLDAIEKGQPNEARDAVNRHLRELWRFTKQSITFSQQPHDEEDEEDIEFVFVAK